MAIVLNKMKANIKKWNEAKSKDKKGKGPRKTKNATNNKGKTTCIKCSKSCITNFTKCLA